MLVNLRVEVACAFGGVRNSMGAEDVALGVVAVDVAAVDVHTVLAI